MVKFGKKIYPAKKSPSVEMGETLIKGPSWSIELVDGSYVLEYLAARHGGGIDRLEVTEADFDDVASGRVSYNEVILRHTLK